MEPGIRQQKHRPFDKREKRRLTLRAERIDPKHLIDGEPPSVDAKFKRVKRFPTHQARFYELVAGSREPGAGSKEKPTTDYGLLTTVRIQLNHGDPADDESRLAAIAENLLAVDIENPQSAIRNPQSRGEA